MERNKRDRMVMGGVFTGLFVILFIFFLYVHPVVPWDGDDWNTVGGFGTRYVFYGLPNFELTNNVFAIAVGSIAGYIAAYVVYPLTSDYVLSFIVVNALMLAASITVSYVFLLKMLQKIVDRKVAVIGTVLFILSAFLLFKEHENSEYLYWQYNQCTTYWYSIPSYLASAFYLYLIDRFLSGERFSLSFKNGILFAVLYIVEFSIMPAGLLITVLTSCALLYDIIGTRKIIDVLKKDVYYILALILFAIKLWCECFRTFGTGYLKEPTDVLAGLKVSLSFFKYTLSRYNRLYLIILVSGLVLSGVCYIVNKIHNRLSDFDRRWAKSILISIGTIIFVWIYFVLFGIVALTHITFEGVIHTAFMYVLYFLLIYITVLCWCYVLQRCSKVAAVMPVLLIMMTCVVVNPKNSYRDIYKLDATPDQRYDIMRSVVEEIKDRNDRGVYSLTAHIPPYNHYGTSLAVDLYLHNITDQIFTLSFVYDAEPGVVFFG